MLKSAKSTKYFFAIFALISISIYNFNRPERLQSILIGIMFLPALIYVFKKYSYLRTYFSPVILASIYYASSFSIGSYIYGSFQIDDLDGKRLIFKMSILGLIGCYSLIVGAEAGRKYYLKKNRTSKHEQSVFNKNFIFLILILGWFSRLKVIQNGRYFHLSDTDIASSTASSSFYISSLTSLPTIAMCLILADSLNKKKPRNLIIGFIFITDIIYHVLSGSRQSLLVPFVAFIYIWLRNGGKRFRVGIFKQIIIYVLAVFSFSLISEYRVKRFTEQISPLDALLSTVKRFFSISIFEQIQISTLTVFERASDVLSMAYSFLIPKSDLVTVIHNPFTLIPGAFIPRILSPDKIDYGLMGNKFGRAIGILNPADYFTSIDFPIPLEGYLWNGYFGIITVCFFSGFIYFLTHNYIFIAENPLKQAIYGSTLLSLFNSPAQIIAHGLFGWIKSFLFTYVIISLLSWIFKVSSTSKKLGN